MSKRTCLYVDESMVNATTGHYTPVLVTEGEAGYHPTDYRYGTDYKAAKATVERANATMGLTHEDTLTIVASSFRAQNTGGGT